MIVVRNVFRLKFGKAKDAKALIQEGAALMKKYENITPRLLTDVTGEFYTLVMEVEYENLASFEKMAKENMGTKEIVEWYQRFVPLVDSGSREIFTVII